jgi:hypothetical protein
VISSSLYLMILLSSTSKRRRRSQKSSDTTLHVCQKQDKPHDRVLPRWVLACGLLFSLSSSISFCKCNQALSGF